VALFLKPVTGHLAYQRDGNPFHHLLATVAEPRYTLAFATTTLLATGGFMLMPFGSAYTVNNLGIDVAHLPVVYLISGLCNIAIGPLVGRTSDKIGKFRVYFIGTAVSIVMVLIYTHLGRTSLPIVIAVNVLLFIGIFSRMIPSQALMSAIPDISQRGSFNAVGASLQQLSGGIGSMIAGAIIVMNADGSLRHFDWLGYIVITTSLVALTLMYFINRSVRGSATVGAAAPGLPGGSNSPPDRTASIAPGE
jgi:predicted MFS family arabinose efflux permease